MSKIVQQIQTRFQFFQIFWLVQTVGSFLIIILSEFFVSKQSLQNTSSAANVEINLGLAFGFLGFSLFFVICSVIATTAYAMLTHGIYNYLKLNKDSQINPTWAVWSIFIPFASYILVAINAKKSYESLGLNPEVAQYNFYASIFYTIVGTLLGIASVFYAIYDSLQNIGSVKVVKAFLNTPFFISMGSLIVGIIVIYFTWKIMKDMTSAIVAEESGQLN